MLLHGWFHAVRDKISFNSIILKDSEITVPKITGLEVKKYHTTVAFTFLACLPLKRILEKFVSPCIILW